MTEQEKKIAFVKRAAEMAGVPVRFTLPGNRRIECDFWTGNCKMEIRYYIPNDATTIVLRPKGYGDLIPLIGGQATLSDIKEIMRVAVFIRCPENGTPLDFRAITFLTALLEFDP